MKTDEALVILKGITNEILNIINSKHESSLGSASKKVGRVLGVEKQQFLSQGSQAMKREF